MFYRIWRLFAESFQVFGDARASQMAAALTYYTMLSLAPTLVIAIAIAGYIFDDQLAEAQILTTVKQFTTPEIAQTIAGLINRANQPESGILAGSISVGILVIGASGAFTQIYDTFNLIWGVSNGRDGFWFTVQKRLIGIAMVLVVGILLILAMVLHSTMAYVNELVEDFPTLLTWLSMSDRSLSFLLLPVVFSIMFWFFPATRIRFWDVVPAGLLTAVLVFGSRYLIQMYLGLSTASEVYGAAGSLVVLLIWVYMTALLVFYGAAFSRAWSDTFGSRSELAGDMGHATAESEGAEPLVPTRRNVDASA